MTYLHTRHAAWRRPAAAVAAAAMTAAIAGLAAAPAASASAAAPAHARAAAPGGAHAADLAARAAARSTGKPVVVSADTTQTSQTIARPDGSFVTTINALPVRVRQHGTWQPVSTTLHRLGSGRWAPRATPSAVTLSGGGSGPLAVLTGQAGGTITIGSPRALPRPVIRGSTATYQAAPGQNLQVTVTSLGGITITATPAGGARAVTGALALPLSAAGLTLRPSAGMLTGKTAAGRTRFTAATYQTLTAGPGGRQALAQIAAASPLTSGRRLILAPARARPGTRQPATSPAHAAAVASVTAAIIPAATAATCSTSSPDCTVKNTPTSNYIGYTEVRQGTGQSWCQNPLWNTPQANGEAIGLEDYGDDPCGASIIYRTYYAFDTSGLYPDMQVQDAELTVTEQYGSDSGCSHAWPVTDYSETGNAYPGTAWSNQPTGTALYTHQLKPYPCGSNGTQSTAFNITSQIRGDLSGTLDTFGIRGDETGSYNRTCAPGNDSENCGFMRFTNNPTIVVTYDLVPDPPTLPAPVISPPTHLAGATDAGCVSSGTYPWLGKQDTGSSVGLIAKLASKITGEQVKADFAMTDVTDPALPVYAATNGFTTYYSSGGSTDAAITWPGGTPGDGHTYKWTVQALVQESGDTGGPYYSTSAGPCYFRVDATNPSPPSVTSTTFPPSGGTTTNNNQGTFNFSATDPVPTDNCTPGPCQASGIYGYNYSLNTPIPATGAQFTPASAPSATLPIGNWGENTLYVQAVDNAGNDSAPVAYTFYVPWNGQGPVPGDITGDGHPDLLGTTSSGGLNLYTGPASGGFTSLTPSTTNLPSGPTPADDQSPDSKDDWNTFQITHRGSLIQAGSYDDLYAHQQPGNTFSGTLYLYKNNPANPGVNPYDNTANRIQITWPGSPSDYNDWSSATQILSPGDAWTGAGTADNGQPSLLVTFKDGTLWAYQGATSGQLCGTTSVGCPQPVELGTGGWNNMTLIAPGTVNGHVTIWARDNTTGTLYDYPLNIDTATGSPTLNQPASSTPIAADSLPAGSGAFQITGITLPATTYPVVSSAGDDATGTSPSLYVIKNDGTIYKYAGTSGTTTGSTPVNPVNTTPTPIGTVPALSITQLS